MVVSFPYTLIAVSCQHILINSQYPPFSFPPVYLRTPNDFIRRNEFFKLACKSNSIWEICLFSGFVSVKTEGLSFLGSDILCSKSKGTGLAQMLQLI